MSRNPSPYFSIIIPTYNRSDMIGRAIESCLIQTFSNFEVIVIDDGSTDGTIERVEQYQDKRIVLFRHEHNRGVCPARNTGIAQARGQWLIMLDSDFELLPDALNVLSGRTTTAPLDVGNVASSCQWDTGIITPSANVPGQPIDYVEYLQWLDSLEVTEWFNCFRKEVFDTHAYPRGRAYESILHLNVARFWKLDVDRDALVIVHTDALNRITASPQDQAMERLLRDAIDCADNSKLLLQEHGQALRKWAPKQYQIQLNRAAMHSYLAGRRSDGLRYSIHSLVENLTDARKWAILFLGLSNANLLAWFKAYRISHPGNIPD